MSNLLGTFSDYRPLPCLSACVCLVLVLGWPLSSASSEDLEKVRFVSLLDANQGDAQCNRVRFVLQWPLIRTFRTHRHVQMKREVPSKAWLRKSGIIKRGQKQTRRAGEVLVVILSIKQGRHATRHHVHFCRAASMVVFFRHRETKRI